MKTILKNQFSALIAVTAIVLFTFSACKKDDDGPPDLTKKVTVTMTGAQEVPAVTSTGSGTAQVSFDPTTKMITYTMSWTLGSSSATTTNMHFHGAEDGSPTKSSGVIIGITGFTSAPTGTISGVTRALTDVEVAQLLAGKWYLNIHSSTNTGGELRGNINLP
jgi:hypothetical protein